MGPFPLAGEGRDGGETVELEVPPVYTPTLPRRGGGDLVSPSLTWVPNTIGEGEDEGEERMQPADVYAIEHRFRF
jgi:hypothetical protein